MSIPKLCHVKSGHAHLAIVGFSLCYERESQLLPSPLRQYTPTIHFCIDYKSIIRFTGTNRKHKFSNLKKIATIQLPTKIEYPSFSSLMVLQY